MAVIPFFVGPSGTSQSIIASSERTMNWYPELVPLPGGKNYVVLYPTPGVKTFASASPSPCRGLFALGERAWAVLGNTLYEINENATLTSRGTVAVDAAPVTFVSNGDGGDELFITSGDRGYILDLTSNVLTEVISAVRMGAFLDRYFLALDPVTSKLRISELSDGLTWNTTQFAQRTAGQDPWESLLVSHRDVWLFGQETSEVWYNAGSSPFPFAPIQGAFLQQGILAPLSAANLDNAPMWLGRSHEGHGIIWRANGYTPQRVSTHDVEFAIQGYARAGKRLSDAVGWVYQEDGHGFYVLTFPSASATWVYDAASHLWHERGSWIAAESRYDAWRAQYHAFVWNRHLVGDRAAGTIFQLANTIYTDAEGAGIRRLRRSAHVSKEDTWIFYSQLKIDLESGVGLVSGQGSDPQVMLRWSNDGGRTWSHEHWVSAGKIGAYRYRARFQRLGRGRDRVFELVVSDPIPARIVNAYLEATAGLH